MKKKTKPTNKQANKNTTQHTTKDDNAFYLNLSVLGLFVF
jgi:hypothetical protein